MVEGEGCRVLALGGEVWEKLLGLQALSSWLRAAALGTSEGLGGHRAWMPISVWI